MGNVKRRRESAPDSKCVVAGLMLWASACAGSPADGRQEDPSIDTGGGAGASIGGVPGAMTAGTNLMDGATGRFDRAEAGAVDSGRVKSLSDTRGVASASVQGYRLIVRRTGSTGLVGEPTPYDLRGISWSPASKGGGAPDASAYDTWADQDFALMEAANINTVKTYGPILDRNVLDRMLSHGILVVMTVFVRANDDYATTINGLKDHPAILMWMVGNEWNRNNLYGTCNGGDCFARVNDVVAAIKRLDPNHPVSTSFSPSEELPSESDMRALGSVDVWGLNIYSYPGFFNRFSSWATLNEQVGTQKPFFMSEYGVDAYNGKEDGARQASVLATQTTEIRAHSSARNTAGVCLGGSPFEWNDEWWKTGSPGAHDPGGMPAAMPLEPDGTADEEWWGIVDIDRKPRAAYGSLQSLYGK